MLIQITARSAADVLTARRLLVPAVDEVQSRYDEGHRT
jgi:hypothetical protein